jgi:hypothetical protein
MNKLMKSPFLALISGSAQNSVSTHELANAYETFAEWLFDERSGTDYVSLCYARVELLDLKENSTSKKK